ncbi:MAG: hypothetical protein QXF76_04050, partial [Candidatus Anstonellales archaeon]
MNGTAIGGTIGSSIGTVTLPGIGTVAGGTIGTVIGGLVDIISGIFGGEDEGHWEGDKFIPGDLQNRINTVNQWIAQYGLRTDQVDWKVIEDILLTPGGWQDRIKTYLAQVKSQAAKKPATTTTKPNTTQTTTQTEQTGKEPVPGTTKAVIDINQLL